MTKKKMNAEKPSISPAEYSKILKGLNLETIYLFSSTSSIEREQLNGNITISVKDKASFVERKDSSVDVYHSYKLAARSKGQRKITLKVECIFCLNYSSKKRFSEEFFEIFKDLNLPINSWPFFREFVHSTTSRMNISPLTIPLAIQR